MSASISLMQDFTLVNCCNCGVGFAMPHKLYETLVETHRRFYCPNGHEQWFTGTTEAERLKIELQREQRLRNEAEEREHLAEVSAEKLRKRLSAGLCPCCNRSFQDLARHMATKHKDAAKLQPAAAAAGKRLQ